MYLIMFNNQSNRWSDNPEMNRLYLECQQNYVNELLKARGNLFLNEVYDLLGIDRSSIGAISGWLMNEKESSYVDFKIVEETDKFILIDFNVQGIIYDKI